MKKKIYFLIAFIALSINAIAQKHLVENAIKEAALVPATGDYTCRINTKPCAVINKDKARTITVKVEESFLVNSALYKKIIVLDKIAPGEKRYVGCAGVPKDVQNQESTGYKILIAYYDQSDGTGVTGSR